MSDVQKPHIQQEPISVDLVRSAGATGNEGPSYRVCTCVHIHTPPGPHRLFILLILSRIYWKTLDRLRVGDVWTLEFECLPGSLNDQREAAAAVLYPYLFVPQQEHHFIQRLIKCHSAPEEEKSVQAGHFCSTKQQRTSGEPT